MAAPSASPPMPIRRCSMCCATISASSGPSSAAAPSNAVLTIEGLGTPEHPHPLQQAFLDEQAGQCGYCLSGILISAKALIDKNPSPSRREIAAALVDNIC